jgi:hypothetical protein
MDAHIWAAIITGSCTITATVLTLVWASRKRRRHADSLVRESGSPQKVIEPPRVELLRILIAGSSRYRGSDATLELFRQTCQEVGRELAARGLHLVVGSWAPDTADVLVLDSFIASRGCRVTIAGIEEKPQSWWLAKVGSAAKATFFQVPGSWDSTGRSVQAQHSDAVFIIGGAQGVVDLSKNSDFAKHRIVATPQLGAAAKSIWDRRVRARAMAVSPDCVRRLESGTASEVANAGLDLLSLL